MKKQYEENKAKHGQLKEKYVKVKDCLKSAEIDALASNKLLLKVYQAFVDKDGTRLIDSMKDIEKRIVPGSSKKNITRGNRFARKRAVEK